MKYMKWKYLKALNELYHDRQTKIKIDDLKDDEGKFFKRVLIGVGRDFVIQKKLGGFKTDIWIPNDKFDEFYEKKYKGNFEEYQNFFIENKIVHTAQQTYKEQDIRSLFLIKNLKEQILEKKPSEKEFLAQFLKKEAKTFVQSDASLKNAVLKILGIDKFEGDDAKLNQWRWVIDCPNAKCIVLCENKDRLSLIKRPLENLIELWYVGGNNTSPLKRLTKDKLQLRIFYTCDWDKDGLRIFSGIKKIIETFEGKVHLLIPPSDSLRFATISDTHKSDWDYNKDFSGLNKNDFTTEAQKIIKELIRDKKYIQEEGIDLIEMVNEAMVKLNEII